MNANLSNAANLICEIHNSPIGAVCAEKNCNQKPFLFCIKCIVDENLCVRSKNHKIMSINEFFETHLNAKSTKIKEFIGLYKKIRDFDFKSTLMKSIYK